MSTHKCRLNKCVLTCNFEIPRAVGLSSVILGKAGVVTLIIFGGIEDLQTPIIHDGNAKNEHNKAKLLVGGRLMHIKGFPVLHCFNPDYCRIIVSGLFSYDLY